eukprot:4634943-Pyramimonas_sp.AAC.1
MINKVTLESCHRTLVQWERKGVGLQGKKQSTLPDPEATGFEPLFADFHGWQKDWVEGASAGEEEE